MLHYKSILMSPLINLMHPWWIQLLISLKKSH